MNKNTNDVLLLLFYRKIISFRPAEILSFSGIFFYLPYLSSFHEKAMYRYVLDGKSALAWELPFQGHRDVAAAPQTPQLGGPRPTLGAQVSLKLLFGYVTIFSSADLFTTDSNCRKKLACDIISECNVILSRRI